MTHETMNQHRSDGRGPVPGGDPAGVVVPLPVHPGRRPGHRTGDRSAVGPAAAAGTGAFTIDCADCAHRDTPVCGDCVVSFIVGRELDDALVVDADEARAVRLLERAGLVPGMRHQSRASGL